MKIYSIRLFKEKLSKAERLSMDDRQSVYLISSVCIKSLLFTFRISRMPLKEFGCCNYFLGVHVLSYVFTDDCSGNPVPLDLFKLSISKVQFISAFCLLHKLSKVLLKSKLICVK